MFQSAPPTEARGDSALGLGLIDRFNVSIRSPHRGEGRWTRKFFTARKYRSFNPLPPPRRGEISHIALHSPQPKAFQSAPPTEARGDPKPHFHNFLAFVFQSAPPTEARGDAGRYNQLKLNKLDAKMRDSTTESAKIPDSTFKEHAKLLLSIKLRAARKLGGNAVTLLSRQLQNQRGV